VRTEQRRPVPADRGAGAIEVDGDQGEAGAGEDGAAVEDRRWLEEEEGVVGMGAVHGKPAAKPYWRRRCVGRHRRWGM
jgi:hypothetical protein